LVKTPKLTFRFGINHKEPSMPRSSRRSSSLRPGNPLPAPGADQDTTALSNQAPTADQVLAEIEARNRRINDLIESLPEEERGRLLDQFRQRSAEEIGKWFGTLMKGWSPEQCAGILFSLFKDVGDKITEEMFHGIRNMGKDTEARVRDRFTVKPRMVQRDDEVVRLRDEKKLSWYEILNHFRKSKKWAKNQGGRLITIKALKAAYRRRKQALAKATD
jgi:hypothetical protein